MSKKKAKQAPKPQAEAVSKKTAWETPDGQSRIECTWTQNTGIKPLDAPKPVQFTARELSYLLLNLNLQLQRLQLTDDADPITLKIVTSACCKAAASMREWWAATESAGAGTWTVAMKGDVK